MIANSGKKKNKMFVPFINSIKALLLFHNDAHNLKITGILKQNSDGRSDMFRFT
jgi:hypothetical protein